MADNLTIGVGVDTSKLRADMAVLKTELSNATKQLESYRKEASKTGDYSKLKDQARYVEALNRQYLTGTATLRTYNRALAEQGVAAFAASRGFGALNSAHKEFAEKSEVNVREIAKISKELGGMEASGFAVAKMFKEFPKIAVPAAITAGVAEFFKKEAAAAYDNITALDKLSKSTGFYKSQIMGLKGTFAAADAPASSLEKVLTDIGKAYDAAKVKSTDFYGAMSGVGVGRGPGVGEDDLHGPGARAGHGPGARTWQSLTPGMSDYQAPPPRGVFPGGDAPGTPSRQIGVGGEISPQGVVVMRGGAPLGIDPSKGIAGLLDPSQFKEQTAYFAALQKMLQNINQMFPALMREILRAQGWGQDELRGFLGSTPQELAKRREEALTAPEVQPENLDLARRAGAGARQIQEERDRAETTAGLGMLQGFARDAPKILEGIKAFNEGIAAIREKTTEWINSLKSIDWSAAANSFTAAYTAAFADVGKAYDNLKNYMEANPLPVPMGTGTIPPPANEATGAPYAAGGIVGGVGSGDTVPAWLTPGEFVNRRASVNYYGAGLFSALNSRAIPRDMFSNLGFAVGGLVGDAAAHFAEGGLAMTPAGTAVHLHLDGQSFATTASESVASALVATARRAQMRSAGLKPSWYGGRAGA